MGVVRSSFYRIKKEQQVAGPKKPRPTPPNKISAAERAQILEHLHSGRFADKSPREIVPTLLDEGIYLASIRTFYNILSALGESGERRLQASHPRRSAPILEATGPNQLWSWDITRIKGPFKGEHYFLYVMIDVFSRYVVGWMLAERENARRAQNFIRETVRLQSCEGSGLTVHNDRGSPMKAGTTIELIQFLGLRHSFSRPRTSDDNPYSESHFKTLKYSHAFPGFFDSMAHAEGFLGKWFEWYNNEHHHIGLNLNTPRSVYRGDVTTVVEKRQSIMDLAYSINPERFSKGRPIVKLNPPVVGINLHLKHEQILS